MSEVRCESVSHASRTELCSTRRYSALPHVYVRMSACVCERCGLSNNFIKPCGSIMFLLIYYYYYYYIIIIIISIIIIIIIVYYY